MLEARNNKLKRAGTKVNKDGSLQLSKVRIDSPLKNPFGASDMQKASDATQEMRVVVNEFKLTTNNMVEKEAENDQDKVKSRQDKLPKISSYDSDNDNEKSAGLKPFKKNSLFKR